VAEALGPGPAPALTGLFDPLRRSGFRWLVTGQMLSTFGDLVFTVALPFMVLRQGDVADLSITLLVLGLSRILGSPVGGVLADRWQPRTVMLGADIGRAGVLGLLVALASTGEPGLLEINLAIAALGVLDGLFVPAYWAMTPTVLPEEELAAGNAVGESMMILAVMVGPLVGGLAMASMPAVAVISLNALTFVVSAGTLLKVCGRAPTPIVQQEGSGDGPAFREFAKGSKLFLSMLVMTGILHLTSAGLVSVALPVFADQAFPDGERVYGLLLGAQGAGLLIGTLAAGLSAGLPRRGYLSVALLAAHGIALTAFGALSGLPSLLIVMGVVGLVSGSLAIIVITLLQRISPVAIRGRVMGAFTSVAIGSYPISVVLIGFLVTQWGARSAFLVGGSGVLAVAAFGLARRAVREA
jgi:MFS family permease